VKKISKNDSVRVQYATFHDFFIADLQVFDFCRRLFTRDFIDHVTNPYKGCLAVYGGPRLMSCGFYSSSCLQCWIFSENG